MADIMPIIRVHNLQGPHKVQYGLQEMAESPQRRGLRHMARKIRGLRDETQTVQNLQTLIGVNVVQIKSPRLRVCMEKRRTSPRTYTSKTIA